MAPKTPFTNASGQSYIQNYDFNPYATVRTLPVQDWVQQAISNAVYAADPSLQIRVSSGGQTASRDPKLKNAPGGWTGSTRHDEGGAADFSLVRNGEKLPIRGNEALYQSVARNLAAQGVPGIGVDIAAGYIHAGGGDQAAWGYQGQSASSKYLPASFASAITEGRQLYGRGTGIPTPPGEVPNVVASQLDTQRPQNIQGTGQQPTSAISRAFPTRNATPRLAQGQDGIYAYNPPDMQRAQITPGIGSLTPDFFRRDVPSPRLDPRSRNRMDLASFIPGNVMRQDLGLQGMSYAGMDRALPSTRPIGFPTPVSQRPAQSPVGFPTPVSQRPIMAASAQPLRVTVNGGNYAAPQPSRAQQVAEVLARSRGPSAFGGGGTIDGAVQPVGTLFGRR